MVIEPKDLLGFAIDRGSAVNGYWNLYIVVATGLVGVMASGRAFTNSRSLKFVLSFAFVVFAYSNLEAILRLGELRSSLLQMFPPEMASLKASLAPARFWVYWLFHGTLDLLVLASFWVVPWPDRSGDDK